MPVVGLYGLVSPNSRLVPILTRVSILILGQFNFDYQIKKCQSHSNLVQQWGDADLNVNKILRRHERNRRNETIKK